MVKEITQYQSDSGRTFPTRREALIDDLAHAIKAAGNDVIAKNVANEIANNIDALYPTIRAIRDETRPIGEPCMAPIIAPSLRTCRHNYVPVKGKQLRHCEHCGEQEPIPTISAKPEQE